jgi:hypothetical protein
MDGDSRLELSVGEASSGMRGITRKVAWTDRAGRYDNTRVNVRGESEILSRVCKCMQILISIERDDQSGRPN